MKTIYLLLFCIIALLNSGCKKCETTTHYPLPVATELYFGMYKMGNWWTYENQEGTKKDSIYLTEFYDKVGKDVELDECTTWQYKQGNMISKYLYSGLNVNTEKIAFTYGSPYTNSADYTYVELSGDVRVSFRNGMFQKDTIIPNYSQNLKMYSNVLKNRNRKYFAPNIGLIRWETTTDTFTLKKYYIQ